MNMDDDIRIENGANLPYGTKTVIALIGFANASLTSLTLNNVVCNSAKLYTSKWVKKIYQYLNTCC